jgi:hypothetical protein
VAASGTVPGLGWPDGKGRPTDEVLFTFPADDGEACPSPAGGRRRLVDIVTERDLLRWVDADASE